MRDRLRSLGAQHMLSSAERVNWIALTLDDVGTGYASLGNLQNFSFDRIMTDRSFVGADAGSRAFVRAVAQLGIALGLSTTADEVKTVQR
jgi:EAL domain-containing protein (putative c-di-GMP-specific phosphodiesterase class I)